MFTRGSKRSPNNDAQRTKSMKLGRHNFIGRIPQLWASSSSSKQEQDADLPNVSTMRLGDIKQELESYGISTKTFLEKKEMVQALEKARAEGKTPISKKGDTAKSAKSDSSTSGKVDRGTRIAEEMEKARAMKVGELKKALQDMNVSTKSMFEKSEFVRAYAEAVVDGVPKNKRYSRKEEPYDPEYRDVVMQKMTRGDPRMLQGVVIDVKAAS